MSSAGNSKFYDIDGEQYERVTYILSVINKPALVAWAAREERTLVSEVAKDLYFDAVKLAKPLSAGGFTASLETRLGKAKQYQRQMTKASEIGKQAHAMVEWRLRKALGQVVGPEPQIRDEALWAYMAWEDWYKANNVKPIAIEQTVFSKKFHYAGTLDLLAEVDGVLTITDWKSGKNIYAESHLQNFFYQQAIDEMGHGPVKQGRIVRLPKVIGDPGFEVTEVPHYEPYWKLCLAVKTVWEWWHEEQMAYDAKRKAEKEKQRQEALAV